MSDRAIPRSFRFTEGFGVHTFRLVNDAGRSTYVKFHWKPMQGRNFSYLDTQLKRLGGPDFAQLPVNAPKCPIAHFQQDGHMAMVNPVTRVNHEPNSWSSRPRRVARGRSGRVRRPATS